MRAWGITDIGLRRHENQDSYSIKKMTSEIVAAVVCDGMGGVNGGRLASSLAVSTFMDTLCRLMREEMTVEQVRDMQGNCIERANRVIYDRSQDDPDYRGMGTTLVSVVASTNAAVVCNVGDSRAYHIGADGIRRITRDHSVVEEMVESGEITPEEARTHPKRNLITRALGPDKNMVYDAFTVPFAAGDSLLLCTDGLSGTATDDELLEIVRGAGDGAAALELLLTLAKRRGAPDNVTAVLIRNSGEEVRDDG